MLGSAMFGGEMKKTRIYDVQIQGRAHFWAVRSQRKVGSWIVGRGEQCGKHATVDIRLSGGTAFASFSKDAYSNIQCVCQRRVGCT